MSIYFILRMLVGYYCAISDDAIIYSLLEFRRNCFHTQHPIENQGLPTDCWPHIHLSEGSHRGTSSQLHVLKPLCISRPELPVKIRSLPNFSRCWVGTDSTHWPKIFQLLPRETALCSNQGQLRNFQLCLDSIIYRK